MIPACRWPVRAVVAFALAAAVGSPLAAPPSWPDALAGRLRRIDETRTVRLGYREAALPFSYVAADGRPIGYSIDLCRAIVATIAEDLGAANLAVDFVRVDVRDRIDRVAAGDVDLECGSTTITAERRQRVAFSPVIFVTGTRLAVPRGSAVRGPADLRGRSVAVVRGTPNEAALREYDRLRGLGLRFVEADGYRDALDALAAGRADALAADDVLLRGFLVGSADAARFRLVGELLSFEPYGITYPRDDPALADAVDRTLRALAASREIVWTYDRWFVRPLPSGGRLGLPMSAQLRRSLEILGLPTD